MKPTLVLDSIDTYKESSLGHLKYKLKDFFENHSEIEVENMLDCIEDMNAYENLGHLKPLSQEHVIILDEDRLETSAAEKAVLDGEVFWEHAAAGEATRLGLGTKYMIFLNEMSTDRIMELRRDEIEKDFANDPEKKKKALAELTRDKLKEQMGCEPEETMPISLGVRHMLQIAFDIRKLAKKHGQDPHQVQKRQHMLVVMNESTGDKIADEWAKYNHFGFDPGKILFMIQKSFQGIDVKKGQPFYDESHDAHKRLHNHGQMVMQKTHDDEIFRIVEGKRRYLKSHEFEQILSTKKDMISYNIEDINYLTGSIDWHSLALALELGSQGYGMAMEIVAQNPLKPQKGGAAFFDEKKGRPVMIESNQLKGIKNEEIQHLNKNFNHYPNPSKAFKAVKEGMLDLHTCIKKAKDKDGNDKQYLYFCTPQGDINFLVKTAYVMRKELKPIANWKSPATTPPTVRACWEQDRQPGFKEFAEKVLGKI
ncbi:TPA: hypothetical protein HA265_03755 [Candidatus Woesearchaeota archaeon]|nr:hypothetical protein [Candidatus Woesearchaeota archaeon]